MNMLDLVWLAGLLEGEGCFTVSNTQIISLGMNDKDVVERASRIMRTKVRDARQGKFFVTTACGDRARMLMTRLRPYMGRRRGHKIDWCLEHGPKASQVKLTKNEVIAIRNLYETTDISQRALATKYSISQPHVHDIIHRKVWKEI